MSIITILLFFVYFYGLGFSVVKLLKIKEIEDSVEKNVIRLALGFPVFIFLGVLLNFVKIPLNWWLFLIISIIYPIYHNIIFRKNFFFKIKMRMTKQNLIYFVLLLIFIFSFYMYVSGSFSYEYLEDDDPWTYTREMKYVAFERKLDVPYHRAVGYLDPYPPAYTMTMGILHQTSIEAQWTIKFFNSLLISLGIVFFFFMVRRLTDKRDLALLSTFVLSMIPCYLSHFIWSHVYIPFLFFILIYCYSMIKYDKNWWQLAAIVTAAICLTHTLQVIKLAILAIIFFLLKWVYDKEFPWKIFWASLLGFLSSLIWFIPKFKGLMSLYITEEKVASSIATADSISGIYTRIITYIPRLLSPTGGSGTRAYSFSDFFYSQKTNMINNPIGWGVFITILLVFTLVYLIIKYKTFLKKENFWLAVTSAWFLFTFLFVNSETFNLPIGFAAFRMWMLLAIPTSILVAYGITVLMNMFPKYKVFILLIMVLGIIFTSGYAKYYHNTNSNWPSGGKWTHIRDDNGRIHSPEIEGYVWVKNNLPLNSRVFTYSIQTKVLYGFNMFPCTWCQEFREFHPDVLFKNITVVYDWLKANKYEYLIFSSMEYKYLGKVYGQENATTLIPKRLKEIQSMSDKFRVVHQNQAFILFKVI